MALGDLSRRVSVSPSKLGHAFKERMGISPIEYLINVRLSKAVSLMESNGSMKLAAVARSCGFSDPRYFARAFRKRFHCTPSEYAPHAARAE